MELDFNKTGCKVDEKELDSIRWTDYIWKKDISGSTLEVKLKYFKKNNILYMSCPYKKGYLYEWRTPPYEVELPNEIKNLFGNNKFIKMPIN